MAKKKATRTTRASRSPSSPIAYCRVFPPVGIARVGNSEAEFFIGPEVPGPPVAKTFKDETGRVKRQAARFRVYAFDRAGRAIRELTLDDKDVEKLEWSVTLANKKAAWHRFEGTQKAANIISNTAPLPQLRNSDLEGSARDRLVIGPSTGNVSGANAKSNELKGRFDEKETVYLGELKTDERGRLLVLGGLGKAATTRDDNPLRDYANNDRWYDDTSDGPVTVKVTINGKSIPVRGRAWVIVAPPHYSPHTHNVVTAYDVMAQAALDHDLTWNEKELGPKPSSASVSFQEDILPILKRTVMYQWVNRQAQRGHSAGKRGDFTNPRMLRLLADPKAARQTGSLHKRIFERMRTPLWYPLMPKAKEKSINLLDPKSQEARNEANLQFMPPISGDEGDTVHSEPWKWQTVTELQYEKLRAWKDGDFDGGVDLKSQSPPGDLSKVAIQDQPRCLVQASLAACQGGAFYPGIEVTSIIRHKQFYEEAFRVSDDLGAGDITKWMALPWLADFHACSFNWWPTIRPDDVVPVHEYEEILKEFEIERSENDLATLLINRQPWDRGVRRLVGRPGLPPVDVGDTADKLYQRATTRISTLVNRYITARALRPSYDPISNTTQATTAYREDVVEYVGDSLGIRDLVLPAPKTGEDAESYRNRALPEISKRLRKELELPKPLAGEDVDDYNERLTEFIDANDVGQNLINLEWRVRNRHSGKADFLDKWWQLGFVLPRTTGEDGETVFVESERGKYDLLDFRDYFYLLMNEEHYPDFLEKARELAEEYLRLAEEFYPVLRSDLFGDNYISALATIRIPGLRQIEIPVSLALGSS